MGPVLERAQMPMRQWDKPTSKRELRAIKLEFALWLLPVLIAIGAAIFWLASSAHAHSGGLAADGCHNDRKNGSRHCHGGSSAGQTKAASNGSDVYYPNCTAARAAGAAPINREQLGYGNHLNRDDDGKACE